MINRQKLILDDSWMTLSGDFVQNTGEPSGKAAAAKNQ
jgi:hypothetical protein